VKVTGVDPEKNQLTVMTPSGETKSISVEDPKNQAKLSTLKRGDRLDVTYTEAMAASIHRM
jgi:hypothetical protein